MKIIEKQNEQKRIKVWQRNLIFDNGDEVSIVELHINGTTIEISTQEWVCGHKTDPNIIIHNLKNSELNIFSKVTKKQKKLPKSNSYYSTIKNKGD